jgi:DNA polymerase-3 subunit delta'
VIRRAEEFSVAAANALLKTLEEPGANTHFILLSDKPDRLLSTIRSRTQRLRFGFLHEAEIETILVTSGMDSARARTLASLAGGSAGQAFRLADAEVTGAMEAFVRKASDALQAGDLSDALGLAEDSKKTKGDLPALLGAFGLHLAARAKQMAQTGDPRCDIEAHRFALVLAAQRQLDGNASPQLTLEALFSKLRSLA